MQADWTRTRAKLRKACGQRVWLRLRLLHPEHDQSTELYVWLWRLSGAR